MWLTIYRSAIYAIYVSVIVYWIAIIAFGWGQQLMHFLILGTQPVTSFGYSLISWSTLVPQAPYFVLTIHAPSVMFPPEPSSHASIISLSFSSLFVLISFSLLLLPIETLWVTWSWWLWRHVDYFDDRIAPSFIVFRFWHNSRHALSSRHAHTYSYIFSIFAPPFMPYEVESSELLLSSSLPTSFIFPFGPPCSFSSMIRFHQLWSSFTQFSWKLYFLLVWVN